MLPFSILIPVLLILFTAAFIRSSVGFGDAVLAMPLLALLIPVKTATPLVAFCATTMTVSILIGSWRKTDWRITFRLVVATLIGIPPGLFLLKKMPDDILKLILGALICLYGLFRLFEPGLRLKKDIPILTFFFGLTAGLLGGAYNTNGPPIVIYGTLRAWPPARFRATLQGYFLPTGFLILIGHGFSGLWTADVFLIFGIALPAILLGVFIGGIVHPRLQDRSFDRLVSSVLFLTGLLLLLRVLFV